jgi:hypothetical protein
MSIVDLSRSRLGVKRVVLVLSALGVVYLKQQTLLDPVGRSHLGQ